MNENSGIFNKKDAFASIAIGETIAWLLYIMVRVNAPELPISEGLAASITSINAAIAMAIVLPILSVLGLYVAALLSKIARFVYQAAKFALVGALNTFLDLGILNLLILVSSISSGPIFSSFKGFSFIVAVINSYFWNKIWTFESGKSNLGKEFSQFLFVSGIGFLLNVGTTAALVDFVGPQFGIAANPWASLSALAGTFIVLLWNFVGYKFWVFKK